MTDTVALLTDFGTRDPYVGVMKGVIATIHPTAHVIDVTHGVPPQDVRVGAVYLEAAFSWFPPGTVFVGVVDPGVGSDRAVVGVHLGERLFVGPDNGLVDLVARKHPPVQAVRIEAEAYRMARPSRTFHGRDIMAPAAAHLARGVPLSALGPPVESLCPLQVPDARPDRPSTGGTAGTGDAPETGAVRGVVLYCDHFGNAITNLPGPLARGGGTVAWEGGRAGIRSTYAQVEPGEALALVGSTDRLEVSVRNGNAARALGLAAGDAVVYHPPTGGRETSEPTDRES